MIFCFFSFVYLWGFFFLELVKCGVFDMTEREKELLLAWVVNEQQRLDLEYSERLQRVRYRESDITDFIEIMLLLQRRSDFADFSACMLRLLNMR